MSLPTVRQGQLRRVAAGAFMCVADALPVCTGGGVGGVIKSVPTLRHVHLRRVAAVVGYVIAFLSDQGSTDHGSTDFNTGTNICRC